MAGFDPYHKWLGIPQHEQPPNHDRLLGVETFESDVEVIENAADQRMAHVRSFQHGQHAEISQKILNKIAVARAALLNPQKKIDYDTKLQAKFKRIEPQMRAFVPAPQQQPAEQQKPSRVASNLSVGGDADARRARLSENASRGRRAAVVW